MRRRKRIENMTDKEAERLTAAFHALNGLFAPPFHYEFWSSVHLRCPHHSGLFLPWHRAYLFAFEEALQTIGRDEMVTLPYWDWVTQPHLPALVTDPASVLYRQRFKVGADPQRPYGAGLPHLAEVNRVQTIPDFKTYGGAGCAKDCHGGELEAIHDPVHLWVGPEMALPETAARDPLFWFHHANVDRLWAEWQQTHVEGPPCGDAELRVIPNCWKVRDVLSITSSRLGYEYVTDATTAPQKNIPVKANAFAGVMLTLLHPAARVHLLLENIRLTMGARPGMIELFAPGADQPFASRALFGLMNMSQKSDEGIDHDHHSEEGHGGMYGEHSPVSLRIDVTDQLDLLPGQEIVLRMRTTGSPAEPNPAAITIGQATLVSMD